MIVKAHLSSSESERLKALQRYRVLDTGPERAFDDLTRLASHLCGTPVALISFMDEGREWFKSRLGWERAELPREWSLGATVLAKKDLILIPDARQDERLATNPLVQSSAPNRSERAAGVPPAAGTNEQAAVRFYAGAPLINPQGHLLGTLSVLDYQPRELTPLQIDSLTTLAHQVVTQLELRLHVFELEREAAEHRRTEQILRETETKYRGIFENVAEGIFQTTPDGKYISANPMLARIYGYADPEELIANIHDVAHQVYVEPNRRDEFARLLQSEDIISDFESQVYRRDGNVIWISENARAVRDASGQVLYYEGTVEDITKRKRAEEALRESELLYHSLVENLPQNIFRKDLEGRVMFGNQRYCDTLGIPLEKLIGKTDFDLFPTELAAKYRRDDRRVLETQEIFETVEAHQKPTGEKIYVQVVKTPLYDAEGKVTGVQGIFWDVTERKRIEEQLAFERDLLRALMDNVPDRIFFKDTQSRFLKCSLDMAKRLGLEDPEQVVGKTDFDFHPAADAEEFYRDEQRIIQTGQPLINKIEKQTGAHGQEIWASVTKVPTRNRAGHLTGIIGISRDITALKQAEEQLATARDAALETARLKSEFLATMSHEVRTPMNGIIGMSGLLLETDLTPEQRDFSETIRSSAHALLDIINDILDFSKIEAGKLVFETIDFDLREVVESTVELLAERAQAKGLEMASLIHEDVPVALRGDPGRLRQVLMNLVGNAVKFTEEGDVVVRISKEHESETHVTLKLTVSDTGIGIAPETLSLVFQAFTQADGSTTRKYGGTGLGLAISKQLVELMGGNIGVESQMDEGSTFCITLKLEKQADWRHSLPRQTNLAGVRLLIVDDNATNRQILLHQATAWKMEAVCARSGVEALKLLRREASAGRPFELAILDMQMPGMDGLSLSAEIHADPAIAKIRRIMLTSLGQRFEPEILKEAGISACLLKPVKQSRLFDCLATALAGDGSPGELLAETGVQIASRRPSRLKWGERKLRILLAEDNSVNLKVALLQLHKLGLSADTVANGSEVLEAMKRIPYEIILMDCQMPILDGYQTTRQIRAHEKEAAGSVRPPVYIIAMTAHALYGDREECLTAGMDDYITKPMQIEDLRAALQRWTDRRPAIQSDASSLDLSVIQDLRELREEGQPDPVAELIDLFLQDAPHRLETMQASFAARDLTAVKNAAHALKGSASNLGARALATLCASLERQARLQALTATPALLEQIQSEFARVRQLLEAEKVK